MDLILIRAGLALFAILGSIHLIYTLLDLKDPKRFAPADPVVLAGMQASKTRFPSAHSYWRSSLGFHLSHSLGLIAYALIFIALSWVAAETLFFTPIYLIMIGAGVIYAILACFFWFYIPFYGSVLGSCLLALGVIIH